MHTRITPDKTKTFHKDLKKLESKPPNLKGIEKVVPTDSLKNKETKGNGGNNRPYTWIWGSRRNHR